MDAPTVSLDDLLAEIRTHGFDFFTIYRVNDEHLEYLPPYKVSAVDGDRQIEAEAGTPSEAFGKVLAEILEAVS